MMFHVTNKNGVWMNGFVSYLHMGTRYTDQGSGVLDLARYTSKCGSLDDLFGYTGTDCLVRVVLITWLGTLVRVGVSFLFK